MTKKDFKRKKQIWLINQFANTPDMPGSTRHFEIASYLSRRNLAVKVFSSDFNLSKRDFLKLKGIQLFGFEKFEKLNWIWVKVFPYKKNNWKRYINLISFCINLLIVQLILIIKESKPKVIIASSPQILTSFCSLVFAKLFRITFIFEVRDLWPQILIDLADANPNSIYIRILKWIEKQLYVKSDFVIVLSKGMESYIQKIGAKKISWLPNGPDLEKFIYSTLPKEDEFFNFKRPFKILYAGAHGLANDLVNVVEAAKFLKNHPVQITFIGDGPEKNNLINKSRQINNIKFENSISKDLMPSKIIESDAILISLKDVALFKYGISPNKLYDAYAIGRPIISSIGGDINKEINENKIGLTCEPGKPRDLAEIMIKMYKLPRNTRSNMGLRANKLAKNIYSRKIIRESFYFIIKDLLQK